MDITIPLLPVARLLLLLITLALPSSEMTPENMAAINEYVLDIDEECDYLNDWLTHMSPRVREVSHEIGFSYCSRQLPVYQITLPIVINQE